MGWFNSKNDSNTAGDDDMRRAREQARRDLAGAEAEYKRDPHPINEAAVKFARRHLAELGA